MQNTFYLYILRCVNGAYYVGHTDNIEQRLSAHNLGTIINCYTRNKRPLELVFLQDFPTRDIAFHAERQIKGWSRKKKEAFIKNDWKEIKKLNDLQKNNKRALEDILLPHLQFLSMGTPMELSEIGVKLTSAERTERSVYSCCVLQSLGVVGSLSKYQDEHRDRNQLG